MATMSIRLSDEDKKEADILFKKMGITINSAINMFIKQCVRNQALPFTPTVETREPSKELLEALEEGEQIIKDLKSGKRKGYHNVRQMFEDILNEDN